MRINQPVTNEERELKDGESIVSKTDLKGVITYVNRTFCEISGFSEEELIGAPQNIVRHPDMPPEAFKDLWDTLQAGKSWKGMVKNRSKDGSYYWVEANANPIYENGRMVGYMSLRTRPTREQIAFAENLYRGIREGKAGGWTVRAGRVYRTGLLGLIDKLRRLSVRGRVIAMVAALALFAMIATGATLKGMLDTQAGLATVYNDRLVPAGQIGEIVQRVMANRILVMDAVARPVPEVIAGHQRVIAENRDAITRLWDAYLATQLTPEEAVLARQWSEARARFVQEGLTAGMAALAAGDIAAARDIVYGRLDALYAPVKDGAEKLLDLQMKVGKQAYQEAESDFVFHELLAAGLIVGAIGLGVLLGLSMLRAIVRPLREMEEVAMAVSSGDLTRDIRVTTDDEIGRVLQAIKCMCGNLRGITTDVRSASGGVSQAANEIASGNDDLSQRTQEQASALEETASSMEEMTATVKQNADNARQANQLAAGSRTQAEQGGQVVSMAVAAMSEINASSRRIADIISVIDEIAFQTNLLALNAAVEAARAGEQGRGFAVVASEVRNLAQRSAGAAKEIKDLIQDSVEKVKTGSGLVDESGKTLTGIVDSVKKVTDIVAEIAAASQEQSAGIEQVNKAITQMDEATQQNAALVEEAAAASRSAEEQGRKLVELMRFFRIGNDDTAIVEPARRAASQTPTVSSDDRSKIQAAMQRHARRQTAAQGGGGSDWEAF